jgi:hypothetical protein
LWLFSFGDLTLNLQPQAGENEHAFIVRAHRALMNEVPDFNQRNRVVWDAWDGAKGPSRGRQLAAQKFPAERFSFSPAHCHFAEHDKVEPNGQVKHIGVQDLVTILNENNSQILDRENFQAITLGHTSDSPAAKDPDVIGFAGPYRLGMIGHEKPVFAIFGDEYHRKDRLNDVQSAPRRSIELNTLRSTGQRWFDPIAALGAKAPRLAMPAKYDSTEEADIERYSVVAPAYFPGGSNTNVDKTHYDDETNFPSQEDEMNGQSISDQDIAAIVAAIEQMPEIQFIRSMPQFVTQGTGLGGGDLGSGDPGAMGGAPAGAPGAAPQMPPGAMGGAPAGDGDGDELTPIEDDDDMNQQPQQFSAQRYVDVDRYQARIDQLENVLRQQMGTISQMTSAMEAEHRNASDVKRQARIETLASRYSVIDSEEELEKCLYSAGSEMSDGEFEKHCDSLEKIGARADALAGSSVPRGELPMNERDTARFAAECANAQDIFNEKINQGEWIDWDTALSMARQRRS